MIQFFGGRMTGNGETPQSGNDRHSDGIGTKDEPSSGCDRRQTCGMSEGPGRGYVGRWMAGAKPREAVMKRLSLHRSTAGRPNANWPATRGDE
jgi:hypothetical protein